MNFEQLFPTIIGYDYNTKLVEPVLCIAKEYLSKEEYLFSGCSYKTTFDHTLNDNIDVRLKPFCDYIRDSVRFYLSKTGYRTPVNMEIDVFFNEMYNSDTHERHAHPNSKISGIFYLEAPEGSSPLTFSDPRPFRTFVNLMPLDRTTDNSTYYVQPQTGLCLFYNSWLEHTVPGGTNVLPRYSAPFNVRF